jgi:hypothetical protein
VPDRADVAAALAALGLTPGPSGYDLVALAAAVEGSGWGWSVEPRIGTRPGPARFRALVFMAGGGGFPIGRAVGSRSSRGQGPTEAAALAQALARMLASAPRVDSA